MLVLLQSEAPSGVSGNGSIVDSAATVSGAGLSRSTGIGALLAAASVLLAVGLSLSTGTGAMAAQSSTLSGEGTVSDDAISGAGALHAQAAQVAGAGIIASTGTGALAAQDATLSGAGSSASSGSGSLSAQAAILSSTGIAQWLAHSDDKYLQEDGSRYLQEDATSFFLREEIALTPGSAQISGVGESSSTGTGALQAGASQISGAVADGLRSLLAPWIGGASAPPAVVTAAGYRGMLSFWMGGAAAGAAVIEPSELPVVTDGVGGGRLIYKRQHKKVHDEINEYFDRLTAIQADALVVEAVKELSRADHLARARVSDSLHARAVEAVAKLIEEQRIAELQELMALAMDEDDAEAVLVMLELSR